MAEKAQLMTDDVKQSYFDYNIENAKDLWKVGPPYYNVAGIKICITTDIIFDLVNKVKELRNKIDEFDKEEAATCRE